MQMLTRAFKTTFKQIGRSGWLSWASTAVMTLSFLVTTVFLSLAFVLNLVLKSIEQDPHIFVFYKPQTSELEILKTKEEWEHLDNVETVIYTSEQDAIDEFKKFNEKANPITAEAIRENVLPASLGIRVKNIQDIDKMIQIANNEKDQNPNILSVGYRENVIQTIKEIANIMRLGGGIIIGLLVIVVFLFTLLTSEFKLYNRAEEIGIMQLVGGSLWYIRLPFVLENGIYGLLGALMSNLILLATYFGILHYYSQTDLVKFVYRFFGNLPWPTITNQDLALAFAFTLIIGAIIGMFNSAIAIRRYIK